MNTNCITAIQDFVNMLNYRLNIGIWLEIACMVCVRGLIVVIDVRKRANASKAKQDIRLFFLESLWLAASFGICCVTSEGLLIEPKR